jgi:hypothetical protein
MSISPQFSLLFNRIAEAEETFVFCFNSLKNAFLTLKKGVFYC